MNTEKLKELYEIYGLNRDDFFRKKTAKVDWTIITRQGIEKIQAVEGIQISYEVIECTPNFAAVKAYTENNGKRIETFASAVKGGYKDGNTESWYVLEVAEKRALSRIVLRCVDLYKEGFFAEDESAEFKKEGT